MANKKSSGASLAAYSGMPVDWQAQRDLDTMLECERIEADPKRLAAVKKLAQKRVLELGGVAAESSKD